MERKQQADAFQTPVARVVDRADHPVGRKEKTLSNEKRKKRKNKKRRSKKEHIIETNLAEAFAGNL